MGQNAHDYLSKPFCIDKASNFMYSMSDHHDQYHVKVSVVCVSVWVEEDEVYLC